MQRPTFFARRALLILVITFFFVPFALRGARMAVQGMKNDVKDWLPKEFAETRDLEEFRRYFLSEQFVLVSWDGCYGDENDERYKMFLAKLMPETPPSQAAEGGQSSKVGEQSAEIAGRELTDARLPTPDSRSAIDPDAPLQNPTHYIHRDEKFVGDRLGLHYGGSWYENWGEKGEIWLKGVREGTD